MHAIKDEFEAYGWRRMQAALAQQGWTVNHKKLKRLMREHGLNARPRRRYVAITDSRPDQPIYPDCSRELVLTGPNQLWVADLTYVAIAVGCIYAALIIDAKLTFAALETAVAKLMPPTGCVHHSDRGSQCAAAAYRDRLREAGLIGSMSRRGNPYDNAKRESLMKTLTVEGIYPMAFETAKDVAEHLPAFIDK